MTHLVQQVSLVAARVAGAHTRGRLAPEIGSFARALVHRCD